VIRKAVTDPRLGPETNAWSQLSLSIADAYWFGCFPSEFAERLGVIECHAGSIIGGVESDDAWIVVVSRG